MNLTTLRNMIFQGDMSKEALRYLVRAGGECEYLDYKLQINVNIDHDLASISKDIVGMKNVGGGYIVVGVEDKTWKAVGLDHSLNLDTKLLRDKIRKSTGLDMEVDIVEHSIYLDDEYTKRFAVILVRASAKLNKRRSPSVCRIDFNHTQKWGITHGDIYVRDGDSTVKVTDGEKLVEIIDRLDSKHEYQDINLANEEPSPFAIENGLFRLLPPDYDAFIGREKLKDKVIQAVEQDPRIWIINLHGPGGVGKTALATYVAYYYYQNRATRNVFESIIFLSAKERELNPTTGIRKISPSLFSLENLLENILKLFQHSEYVKKSLDMQKDMVTQILEAYRTLIVLDNMETVTDGRIMQFIRELPTKFDGKVLLTSRKRTEGWEWPVQIEELSLSEVRKFISVRADELDIPQTLADHAEEVKKITGGLPLAIQWTLGRYQVTRDLKRVLGVAVTADSPLLEFSFGNLWLDLDYDNRQALAVLSIFDDPPTKQEWRTALDWSVEKIDRSIEKLQGTTLIRENTEETTGNITYLALPITLTFSRNKLAEMNDLEKQARSRHQEHIQSLQLVAQEVDRYEYLFRVYDATTENQKKAIVLCRMADAQEELGPEAAEEYYRQAFDLEPRSVYVLVKYGNFLVDQQRIGEGLNMLKDATRRCNKRTGFFAFYNLARVYDDQRMRPECKEALERALEYDPSHSHARHMYGVVLSRIGSREHAIEIFDKLIYDELNRPNNPTATLAYSIKTKVITLQKDGKQDLAEQELRKGIDLIRKYQNLRYLLPSLEELLPNDTTHNP